MRLRPHCLPQSRSLRFVAVLLLTMWVAPLLKEPRFAAAATAASANLSSFTPVADAYVYELKPSTNFGHDSALRVDASPTMRSYLRFPWWD